MAASWLRISELFSSNANYVCIVAYIQSIDCTKRTIILRDKVDNHEIASSSILLVSLLNIRSSFDTESSSLSPGQCIQVYGKVFRQGTDIIEIDAQFIRQLGINFDFNEYIRGLILIRDYMANIDSSHIDDVCRYRS